MRQKGWDIAIAVGRRGRPVMPGSAVPSVAPEAVECLRALWSQVFAGSNRARGQCVMLTAAESGEGVSQIASGLALAGAQAAPDHRIALADFNFPRPCVSGLFRLPMVPGVAEALGGQLPLEQLPVQTPHEAIDVLPAGSANGSVLLPSADRAAELIDCLRDGYDCILLDCPAVDRSEVSCILAPLADKVLLVVKAGSTHRRAVLEARLRLERAGGRLIGVVLNG